MHVKEGLLRVKVVPNSGRDEIVVEKGVKVYLKAIADKNKANLALVKLLKKECGLRVEIKSGLRSREKVLRVL